MAHFSLVCFIFKNFIAVWLIYNVLVSGAKQNDSVTHMHTSSVFQILFLYVITEYAVDFPGYIVGLYWLSLFYIVVYIC